MLLGDFDLFLAILETIVLAQFRGQELEFPLRAARKFVVGRKALPPDTINVDKADTHVKRVESHLDLGIFDRCVTHGLAPVVKMIHPYPHARDNLRRAFSRCRKCCHVESFVVGNLSVRALPVTLHGKGICLTWRHAQCRMTNGFVLFIGPVLDSFGQSGKRPHSKPLRISRACIQSRLLRGLCVSQQMIQKFTLHGTKQALLGRSKARFSSRTLMLAHPVEGQQLLKVHAGKLRATINRESCR